MEEKEILRALADLRAREGSIRNLSLKANISYSVLHHIFSGKVQVKNISTGTLLRLFPDLKMIFFKEDYPSYPSSSSEDPTIEILHELINHLSSKDRAYLIGLICSSFNSSKHFIEAKMCIDNYEGQKTAKTIRRTSDSP